MEAGIILWALTACACASWMSARAMQEGFPEFRWYIAGLVASVFAVPFFLYAVRRASLDRDSFALEEEIEDCANGSSTMACFDPAHDIVVRKAA